MLLSEMIDIATQIGMDWRTKNPNDINAPMLLIVDAPGDGVRVISNPGVFDPPEFSKMMKLICIAWAVERYVMVSEGA